MDKISKKPSPIEIETRLIHFSVRVITMSKALPRDLAAKHLASQIIRSATSPALNYGEAQHAESIDDFLHKMKICLKELRETSVCLKIIELAGWFPQGKLSPFIKENKELLSIFTASTRTITNKYKK